jgi:hypothetical protein
MRNTQHTKQKNSQNKPTVVETAGLTLPKTTAGGGHAPSPVAHHRRSDTVDPTPHCAWLEKAECSRHARQRAKVSLAREDHAPSSVD